MALAFWHPASVSRFCSAGRHSVVAVSRCGQVAGLRILETRFVLAPVVPAFSSLPGAQVTRVTWTSMGTRKVRTGLRLDLTVNLVPMVTPGV
ncbi:MAG UNVERIFIED_CONTAM: hypothetical protein LVR18_35200 [Planctomycetaceae bacterium]